MSAVPDWRLVDRIGDRFNLFNGRYPTLDEGAELLRRAGLVPAAGGRAGRLVEGSKSPTEHPTPEAALRLERRGWANQYRLRLDYNLGPDRNPPPLNVGQRATVTLSPRGRRAISDACEFVLAKRGGFCTFLTLTFNATQRAALDAGETTIQREVSRFVDGITKMRRRGWTAPYKRERPTMGPDGYEWSPVDWNQARPSSRGRGWRQQGIGTAARPAKYRKAANGERVLVRDAQKATDALDLVWVAEAPTNEHGEENPHVHVLMRWGVEWSVFPSWARRVEKSIWGNGFATLERLRKPEAAGHYMAKAAGYLTKAASGSDQGRVLGNRYGITRSARAPGWKTVAVGAADETPDLFPELIQIAQDRRGPLVNRRAHYRARLARLPRGKRHRPTRVKLRAALARTRAEISALGFYMTRAGVVLTGWRKARRLLAWVERRAWRVRYRAKPTPWDAKLSTANAALRRASRAPIVDLYALIPELRESSRAENEECWNVYAHA